MEAQRTDLGGALALGAFFTTHHLDASVWVEREHHNQRWMIAVFRDLEDGADESER